jgi:hypothetical protein
MVSFHFKSSVGSTSSLECDLAKEDTLRLLSSEQTNSFSLIKSRVTHCIHHVSIEQTDVTVEGRAMPFWRSISLEGELNTIEKLLRKEVVGDGHGERALSLEHYLVSASFNGAACGYPEFVVHLCS